MPDSIRIWGGVARRGAQHHPCRFDGEALAPACHFHTDRLFLREHHPPYEHVAPHGEVETMAPRVQVGDGGAHPPPIQVVRGPDTNACRVGAVGILDDAVIQLHTGVVEGLLDVGHRPLLAAPDRHRALGAMKSILYVEVAFTLPEEGQHLRVGPLVVAHGRPGVEVFR
jgi:hypothetical protein